MERSSLDILELPSRRSLYEEIANNPGLNKTTLCERTGLAWGTVDYQLHVLVREGLIDQERGAGEVHYFCTEFDSGHRRLYAVLQNLGAKRLAQRLAERKAARLHELSSDLGESRKVVRRHLGRLEEAGAVEAKGLHHRQYRVTKKAIRLLHEQRDESTSVSEKPREPEDSQYQ